MQPKAAPASNLKDCSAQKRAMKGHKKEYKGEVVSQAQKHDSADELEDEWEDDIWLTSDTEAVHNPISTSTRSSRTTSSTADHSTSTAHQVDNNDDDDDDDGMVTAASHRSPLASDGKFVPPSPIVRSLFPRISSKSQGVSRQRKAAGSPSRDIARDRRALGELQHNAVVLAGPPKVYAPDEAHSQWGSVPDSGATVEMQPPSPPSRRPSQYLSQPLPQTHPHPRTRKQQTSSPPQRPHPRPTISHYVSPKPGPAPVPVPVYADTYHTFRPQEQNGLVVHEETRTYACPCPCCPALRDEVRTLRAEMERLRLEVGVVRRGWSAGGRR
ncbi:hypothetical protein LTR39_000080 [Cryomyces antarcticus]|nr:hypothetical protein LTR39_000080 [Cryomyces antarcticus]